MSCLRPQGSASIVPGLKDDIRARAKVWKADTGVCICLTGNARSIQVQILAPTAMLLHLSVYVSLVQFSGSSPVTVSAIATSMNDISLASASASDTCKDIDICRTRYTIIWSSLVTILACVWTAVHRNVPEPERADESRFWRIVGGVLEAAKIVVVTVLVPEWVLAWAVRQSLNARVVSRELEEARRRGEAKWNERLEKLKAAELALAEGEMVSDHLLRERETR